MDLYAIMDIQLQTVKISWSSLSPPQPLLIPDINLTYTLTVTSRNTEPLILQLNEQFYVFTAPKGVTPCEVYNFSVLTTYHDIEGTAYSGDECNVASLEILRMLPSLPDIGKLESSLSHTLRKNATGNITLEVSFSVSLV